MARYKGKKNMATFFLLLLFGAMAFATPSQADNIHPYEDAPKSEHEEETLLSRYDGPKSPPKWHWPWKKTPPGPPKASKWPWKKSPPGSKPPRKSPPWWKHEESQQLIRWPWKKSPPHVGPHVPPGHKPPPKPSKPCCGLPLPWRKRKSPPPHRL
ncbi:hypothetical protein DH2020_004715 [Rehmannia glutinosa]|uniref:Uncharacterized protein n=1 Tax=Rehmannia glutinosa TaxID=99300 RepID=A0ABR0XQE2_REHGL